MNRIRKSTEDGAGWIHPCGPDRVPSAILLDISENAMNEEVNAYDIRSHSGWEDATQGWGRCSPLSCLFVPKKKGKKHRDVEKDYHCILCVDMMHSERQESVCTGDPVAKSPQEKTVQDRAALDRATSPKSSDTCGFLKARLLQLCAFSESPPHTAYVHKAVVSQHSVLPPVRPAASSTLEGSQKVSCENSVTMEARLCGRISSGREKNNLNSRNLSSVCRFYTRPPTPPSNKVLLTTLNFHLLPKWDPLEYTHGEHTSHPAFQFGRHLHDGFVRSSFRNIQAQRNSGRSVKHSQAHTPKLLGSRFPTLLSS